MRKIQVAALFLVVVAMVLVVDSVLRLPPLAQGGRGQFECIQYTGDSADFVNDWAIISYDTSNDVPFVDFDGDCVFDGDPEYLLDEGLDGAAGPTGVTGATGATGDTGPTGPNDSSCSTDTGIIFYDSAVSGQNCENNFTYNDAFNWLRLASSSKIGLNETTPDHDLDVVGESELTANSDDVVLQVLSQSGITATEPQLRLSHNTAGGQDCSFLVNASRVMDIDCGGSGGVTFNDPVTGVACSGAEYVQYGTGGGGFDCTVALTYDESEYEIHMLNAEADRSLRFYADDAASEVPANSVLIVAEDTDTNQSIDELIIAADNGIVYQSCCTGGSECRYPVDACPAAGDDRITMVAGEFYVCTQAGVCSIFEPNLTLNSGSPAGTTAFTFNGIAARTTGNMYDFKDANTTIISMDKDAAIVYPTTGAATQTVYEHTQTAFASPTMVEKFIRAQGAYQMYTLGSQTFDGKSAGFNHTIGNVTDKNTTMFVYGTFNSSSADGTGSLVAGTYDGHLDVKTAAAGGDLMRMRDGPGTVATIGKITSDGADVCYEWWDGTGTPSQSAALCDTGADQVTLEDADMNLETGFDYNVNGVELSSLWSLSAYIQQNEGNMDQEVWGGFREVTTAETIASGSSVTLADFGISKIYVVLNTCSDSAGSITVTGTSVDRDTAAETTSDTDTLTISGTTTDASSTDGGGNVTHDYTDGYMTSKWFRGDDAETDIVLSTTDINCTDMDVYGVSFYQFDDRDGITVNEFNTTVTFANTNAAYYQHLYSVKPTTGDKADINLESSLGVDTGDSSANELYRLRKGNLGVSIDGSSEGIFVDMHPDAAASRIQNINMFLAGTAELTP